MNAKQAKKLRWYARAQEAGMDTPKIHPESGIPSTLLVYNHRKVWTDKDGVEHDFVNRTIQYNPRTSGKGFYRAIKKAKIKLRGDIVRVRGQCQFRAVQMYTQRAEAESRARSELESQSAGALKLGEGSPDPALAAKPV